MTIDIRIDNPSFINGAIAEEEGKPTTDFVGWVTQTQMQVNEAFSQINRVESGEFTTAPGSAIQTIPVSGAKVADSAIVFVKTLGTTPRFVMAANAEAGQINVTMSGDPGNDHVLTWQLLKR